VLVRLGQAVRVRLARAAQVLLALAALVRKPMPVTAVLAALAALAAMPAARLVLLQMPRRATPKATPTRT
jgi:hypothetical protein